MSFRLCIQLNLAAESVAFGAAQLWGVCTHIICVFICMYKYMDTSSYTYINIYDIYICLQYLQD